MLIRKCLLLCVGMVLVLLGPFAMISPIPGGSLVLPCGMALLICESKLCRDALSLLRARHAWLDKPLGVLENRIGKGMGDILKRTNPSLAAKAELPREPIDG